VSAAEREPAADPCPSTERDSTSTPDPTTGCGVTDAVRGAAGVALEALEKRARASRLLLIDRTLYGLADPEIIRRSLDRDEEATTLLRTAGCLCSEEALTSP
jgi:hypothetical protein